MTRGRIGEWTNKILSPLSPFLRVAGSPARPVAHSGFLTVPHLNHENSLRARPRQEPLVRPQSHHPENFVSGTEERDGVALSPGYLFINEEVLELLLFAPHAGRTEAVSRPPAPERQERAYLIIIKLGL